MSILLSLEPQEEARLRALAQAEGISPEVFARELLHRLLAGKTAPESSAGQPLKPRKSAYGLLAQYGPGPSEEEIDESRREMLLGFGEIAP